MMDLTKNEVAIALKIFKNPEKSFNSNNISKEVNLSPMGALKILKRLEKEGILISKAAGKANFYKINLENDYAKEYVKFILRREAEHTSPYIKRWLNELRKLKSADIAIIFGSVLNKTSDANDIDVLFVTRQDKFESLKKEINELNKINEKNIHPIYQSVKDLEDNITKRDKIILNALKGIVVFGEEKLIRLIK